MELSPQPPLDIRATFASVTNQFRRDGGIADFSNADAVFPQDTGLNGQTSFFRHQGVMRCLIEAWGERAAPGPVRVLAAPSSVGCEAYGFSALALGRLGGAEGYTVDAFDKSSLFTRLARVGAYPQEMYYPLEPQWRDLLFEKPDFGSGMVRLREAVAAPVRFLKPQAFEYFRPRQRYDVAMVNNLFMYMDAPQIAQSLHVIADTGAQLVVMTAGRGGDIVSPAALPFVPVEQHPEWKHTALARVKSLRAHYTLWGRVP